MKYNFDEVIERKGTYSLKWDGGSFLKDFGLTDRFDENTIPLFVADMDFQCPQPVIEALHRVADHRLYGYSAYFCEPKYTDAIIQWFKTKRNWEIRPEEIVYVNGTVEGLRMCMEAYTNPGDGVIIQRPVYGPFTSTIEKTGRSLVNSQLVNHNGYYSIDFDDLEEKLADPKNKMYLLCNPHNPSGRVWNRAELTRLGEMCRRHGVILIADEIHGDILRKGQDFHPIASLVDDSRIVTLTAINKTFNTAGLHCSNAVIKDPEMRKKLQEAVGFISPTPFAIGALIAAYNEGTEWLDQVNEYIDGNIDWLLDFLKKKMPKVKCFRPEGTYILWMDFRAYELPAAEIHERIYNRANVVLEGGRMFDPDLGDGFERICVPTRRALLMEAMERIAAEFQE
jgi:cysteine-S-conjugate beta-lyase